MLRRRVCNVTSPTALRFTYNYNPGLNRANVNKTRYSENAKKKKSYNFLTMERLVEPVRYHTPSGGNKITIYYRMHNPGIALLDKFHTNWENEHVHHQRLSSPLLADKIMYRSTRRTLDRILPSPFYLRSHRYKQCHLPADLYIDSMRSLVTNFSALPETKAALHAIGGEVGNSVSAELYKKGLVLPKDSPPLGQTSYMKVLELEELALKEIPSLNNKNNSNNNDTNNKSNEGKNNKSLFSLDLSKHLFREPVFEDLITTFQRLMLKKTVVQTLDSEDNMFKFPTMLLERHPEMYISPNLCRNANSNKNKKTKKSKTSVFDRLADLGLSSENEQNARLLTAAAVVWRNHPLLPEGHFYNERQYKSYMELKEKTDPKVVKALDKCDEDVALRPFYEHGKDYVSNTIDYMLLMQKGWNKVRESLARNTRSLAFNKHVYKTTEENCCPNSQIGFIQGIVNALSQAEKKQLLEFVEKHCVELFVEIAKEQRVLGALRLTLAQTDYFRVLHNHAFQHYFCWTALHMRNAAVAPSCQLVPKYPTNSTAYGFPKWHFLPITGLSLFVRKIFNYTWEKGYIRVRAPRKLYPQLTVTQRAAFCFSFPIRLSQGEKDRTYRNPFQNYAMTRLREVYNKTGVKLTPSSVMAGLAREWYALPQETKNLYDIQLRRDEWWRLQKRQVEEQAKNQQQFPLAVPKGNEGKVVKSIREPVLVKIDFSQLKKRMFRPPRIEKDHLALHPDFDQEMLASPIRSIAAAMKLLEQDLNKKKTSRNNKNKKNADSAAKTATTTTNATLPLSSTVLSSLKRKGLVTPSNVVPLELPWELSLSAERKRLERYRPVSKEVMIKRATKEREELQVNCRERHRKLLLASVGEASADKLFKKGLDKKENIHRHIPASKQKVNRDEKNKKE